MSDTPRESVADLEQQARKLEILIEEATRIHREITSKLSTFRHAGDAASRLKPRKG